MSGDSSARVRVQTEVEVLLGLGANVGDPLAQLTLATERLARTGSIVTVSSVYLSEPIGYSDQPDFHNLVLSTRTQLSPAELLTAIHQIEHALGRTRPFPNAPRTIDIDILSFGDLVLDTPELTLPHPRMHRRAFVLVPLIEIAPDWVHPIFRKTATELLRGAGPLERIERVGRLPNW